MSTAVISPLQQSATSISASIIQLTLLDSEISLIQQILASPNLDSTSTPQPSTNEPRDRNVSSLSTSILTHANGVARIITSIELIGKALLDHISQYNLLEKTSQQQHQSQIQQLVSKELILSAQARELDARAKELDIRAKELSMKAEELAQREDSALWALYQPYSSSQDLSSPPNAVPHSYI